MLSTRLNLLLILTGLAAMSSGAETKPATAGTPDVPKLFDPRALVKPITELECTLSDGSKSVVYKIVVRSLPPDHEMGPWAPATLKDKGGFWEDTVEKKLSRTPEKFGKGAIAGVAAPESANNAGAQTSFIPMLTLGIPSHPLMALMIGALMIKGIVPGPNVAADQPSLFWGVIASMWIGNAMLLVLNLPLVGMWVKLLSVPYVVLFPSIIAFSAIGVFTVSYSDFDVFVLAGFGVLRFMDWMRTNDPEVGSGALGRARMDDATWMIRGVPMEAIGALAGRLDADPWITIPHAATDAQARALLVALDGALEPGRRIWIEWSNETWNPAFPQAAYAIEQGTALDLSADPFQAGLFYHARRATELFAIATDAIGRDRYVGVLAAQSANPWTGEQVATFEGAAAHADVLAIAPYIDGFGDPATAATIRELTVRQLLRRMRRVVEGPLRTSTEENRSVATANGLDLVAYEGGQHLVGVLGAENDARLTALFTDANQIGRAHV